MAARFGDWRPAEDAGQPQSRARSEGSRSSEQAGQPQSGGASRGFTTLGAREIISECSLKLRPHLGSFSHVPGVAYPKVAFLLLSYPACSEGRDPQIAFLLRSYSACSESRVPSEYILTSEPARMYRESRTLKMYPQFRAIPQAPRVVHPQVGPPLRSYPECQKGRVPSNWAPTSELSLMLRGSRTLKLDPHFGARPRAPRVVYPQGVPSFRSYPACSEGRVPSKCTLTSGLDPMIRESCTLKLDPHFGAIPHAPRVAYPQGGPSVRSYPARTEGSVPSRWTLTSELSLMLRGLCTLKLDPHVGAIPHAPRVAYPQVGPSCRSYPARTESRVPSSWTLTSELSRMLRGLCTLKLDPHFGASPHAPRFAYPQNVLSVWS